MRNHSTFGSRPRHSRGGFRRGLGITTASALFAVGGGLGAAALMTSAPHASAQTVTTALPTNTGEAAAAWLASQFTADGLLPGYAPGSTDIGTTLQAIIGLAGVGTEQAQVLAAWAAVTADVNATIAPYGSDDPGRMGYLILAAVAIGEDPTNINGVDVVARLLASQQVSGLFGAGDPTYDGAFRQGIALTALGAISQPNLLGAQWLIDQQCADGSWTAYRSDLTAPCPAVDAASFVGSDTNSTAMAILGLTSQSVTAEAQAGATWLASVQTPSGGFPYFGDPTQPADANSTALSAVALRAAGVEPTEAMTALTSLQLACDSADVGGIAFQPDTDGTLYANVFATAQTLWAFSTVGFPVIDATLVESVPANCTTTTTSTSSSTTTSFVPTTATIVTNSTATTGSTSPTTAVTTTTTTTTTTTIPTTTTAAPTTTTTKVAGSTIARTGPRQSAQILLGLSMILLGTVLILVQRRIARSPRA